MRMFEWMVLDAGWATFVQPSVIFRKVLVGGAAISIFRGSNLWDNFARGLATTRAKCSWNFKNICNICRHRCLSDKQNCSSPRASGRLTPNKGFVPINLAWGQGSNPPTLKMDPPLVVQRRPQPDRSSGVVAPPAADLTTFAGHSR